MEKTRENWMTSLEIVKLLFPTEKHDDISKYDERISMDEQNTFIYNLLGYRNEEAFGRSFKIADPAKTLEYGDRWFYKEQLDYFKDFCIQIKK